MAKTHSADLRLSRGQIIGGFIYFPFYLFLTAWLLMEVLRRLGRTPSLYELNLLYFTVNFLVVTLIFRRFLLSSVREAGKHFWLCLQTMLLAVIFYFALNYGLSWVLHLLKLSVLNLNNEAVSGLLRQNTAVMLICTCIFVPFTEELLCRALLFGLIRRKSRLLAYIVSMLVFALIHIWQYFAIYSWREFLILTLSYLPGGLALAWAYDKSGNIYSAITAHGVINFVAWFIQTRV